MSRRLALIALLFVVGGGAVARCQGMVEQTLSFDEAFSWRLVTAFSTADVVRRTASDVHPPLYYLLLKAWTGILGDGPSALRSLSVLFACATIVMVYVLSRDVYRWTSSDANADSARAAGMIAALLLATSGAHIRWSREARMYSLACLLGTLSTWLLAHCTLEPAASRKGRGASWLLYSLAASLSMYTHNYMIFVIMGQVGWFVLLGLAPIAESEGLAASRRWNFAGLAALGTVFIGYAPWLPVLFWQADQVSHDYWFARPTMSDMARCWADLVVPRNKLYWGEGWAACGIAVGSAGVVAWLGLSGRRAGALIAAVFAASVLTPVTITTYGTAIVSNQTSRYWLVAYVFLLVAIAVVLCRQLDGFERWTFALVLVANQFYWWAEFSRQSRLDLMGGAKALSEYVRTHGTPDQLVVVREPSAYLRVMYHMRNDPHPERVQLLPRKAIDHYNGGPVITDREIKDEDILDHWAGRKVWAVDGAMLIMVLQDAYLPEPWVPGGVSEIFPEPILTHGKLALTESVRRQMPSSPSSKPIP